MVGRLLSGGLVEDLGVGLAAPDTLATGDTLVVILDDAVVRALDGFLDIEVQPSRIQDAAATSAAGTATASDAGTGDARIEEIKMRRPVVPTKYNRPSEDNS
jgi:hypothetical protein